MPRLFADKTFPCGFNKTRKLHERLRHYKECFHEDCQKRAASWSILVEKFKAEKPQHEEQVS